MSTIVQPKLGSEPIVAVDRQTLQNGLKVIGNPIACENFKVVYFYVDYIAGAVGGGFQFAVQWSNDKVKWYNDVKVTTAAIVTGVDAPSKTQISVTTYGSTGITSEFFMSEKYDVKARYVRLLVGDIIATPGSAYVEAYLQGDIG